MLSSAPCSKGLPTLAFALDLHDGVGVGQEVRMRTETEYKCGKERLRKEVETRTRERRLIGKVEDEVNDTTRERRNNEVENREKG